MTDLLSLTGPIFLLIARACRRPHRKRNGRVHRRPRHFVLTFALPALILHALLQQDLRTSFNWAFVIVYAGGSLAVFLAVLLLFRRVLGRTLTQAAIGAVGGSSSNSGFVGFPVAILAVGAPALIALPLAMLVENAIIIPLALGLAEMGAQQGGRPAPSRCRRSEGCPERRLCWQSSWA